MAFARNWDVNSYTILQITAGIFSNNVEPQNIFDIFLAFKKTKFIFFYYYRNIFFSIYLSVLHKKFFLFKVKFSQIKFYVFFSNNVREPQNIFRAFKRTKFIFVNYRIIFFYIYLLSSTDSFPCLE